MGPCFPLHCEATRAAIPAADSRVKMRQEAAHTLESPRNQGQKAQKAKIMQKAVDAEKGCQYFLANAGIQNLAPADSESDDHDGQQPPSHVVMN
jgi:hypothetical protein